MTKKVIIRSPYIQIKVSSAVCGIYYSAHAQLVRAASISSSFPKGRNTYGETVLLLIFIFLIFMKLHQFDFSFIITF